MVGYAGVDCCMLKVFGVVFWLSIRVVLVVSGIFVFSLVYSLKIGFQCAAVIGLRYFCNSSNVYIKKNMSVQCSYSITHCFYKPG